MEPVGDTPIEKFCLMLLKRVEDLEKLVKPRVKPEPKPMCPEAEQLMQDLRQRVADVNKNKDTTKRAQIEAAVGKELLDELMATLDNEDLKRTFLMEFTVLLCDCNTYLEGCSTYELRFEHCLNVLELGGMTNPLLVARIREMIKLPREYPCPSSF